jgi:hypothetical protein
MNNFSRLEALDTQNMPIVVEDRIMGIYKSVLNDDKQKNYLQGHFSELLEIYKIFDF